jgi:hypothetical protein
MFIVTKADARPPRPRTKVKGASKAGRLNALARRMRSAVAADILGGLHTFKRSVDPQELMDAWKGGNYETVDRVIPWRNLDTSMSKAKGRLLTTLSSAAALGVHTLPPPSHPRLRWDMKNPDLRDYVDKRVASFVRDVTHETREHIRNVVARSFRVASTPRDVAREIVGSIGLHERYANALNNRRVGLIGEGKPAREVDRLTDRYEQDLLKARSMAVARTETRRATNHGQRSIWREAGRQGLIDPKSATRIWVINEETACEDCEPMDGAETTLEEPYEGGLEPGEVHPNCECVEIIEFQ